MLDERAQRTKEDAWNYVLKHFVLDPNSRKQTLQSIATKWRNFKHKLYKKFIEPKRNDPKALLNPPTMYRFLTKEDWKVFVAQRLSKKWQDQSKKAKEVRAQNKCNHHLSRKGYAGLAVEIMQKTGKKEEEIDRATLWKEARKNKTGDFDENVQVVVNIIISGVMKISVLKVLLKTISTFDNLQRHKNITSEPVQIYHQKIKDILKLVKPVLESIADTEVASEDSHPLMSTV